MNIQQPLIEAPASDNYRAVQTLGYLDAYDAVLNDDYAFVAFKETEKSSGSYEIKIKSRHTAGAVFDPAMIRAKCREAGAHNQPYFTWGYSCEPSAGDPRRIEFRVHQRNGAPDALEIVVVTRKADGSAQDPKSLVAIESPVSYPYFEHFRDQRQLFAGATAYMAMVPFSVALEGAVNAKSERIFGHLVSTEYFQVLGVKPARGRMLSPEDDKPGGPPVAVVSDRFWRTRMEADPRAVGRTVKINSQTVTCVSPMSAVFTSTRTWLTERCSCSSACRSCNWSVTRCRRTHWRSRS